MDVSVCRIYDIMKSLLIRTILLVSFPDRYMGEGTFAPAENETVQNFPMHVIGEKVQYVKLHIMSNYGNPDYTCLYRFRIHGNM